jgi:solute carrier family 35, member C2
MNSLYIALAFWVSSLAFSFIFYGSSRVIIAYSWPSVAMAYVPALQTASLVSLWYGISVTLTLYQKYVLNSVFSFPFTVTLFHLVIKYLVFTVAARYLWLRDCVPPPLPIDVTLRVLLIIGLTTSLDIALSNDSVMDLSVSLYTILKSTTIVFTFGWGLLLSLEAFTWQKTACISLLLAGIGLVFSQSSDDGRANSLMGSIFCLAAAACGGLRWTLLEALGKFYDASSKSAYVALYRISPYACAFLLPIALLFEFFDVKHTFETATTAYSAKVFLFVLGGGAISLSLILVEVSILNATTALTFR